MYVNAHNVEIVGDGPGFIWTPKLSFVRQERSSPVGSHSVSNLSSSLRGCPQNWLIVLLFFKFMICLLTTATCSPHRWIFYSWTSISSYMYGKEWISRPLLCTFLDGNTMCPSVCPQIRWWNDWPKKRREQSLEFSLPKKLSWLKTIHPFLQQVNYQVYVANICEVKI